MDSTKYKWLFDEAYDLIPAEVAVEAVEDRAGGVGEVDGEAAAALEFQVEEFLGFVVDGNGGSEGGVEAGELVRRGTDLGREVAQIVEVSERRGGVVIALDAIYQLTVYQRTAMRLDNVPEGLRERLQFATFDQRNGAGTVASVLRIVVVVIVEAVGLEVGFFIREHVPRKDRIAHPRGEDFGGRNDQPVAHLLELPGHLDGARQADVQDHVVQVERDGCGELRNRHPFDGDGTSGSAVLIADGACAKSLGAITITWWQPATSMRREEHAVMLRREEPLDVFQHAADGFAGGADGHVGIDFQGVRSALPLGVTVEAHQHGRVGRGIVAVFVRGMAEGDDGLVAFQTRENVALEIGEVLQEVGREVVVAQAVVDEDLVEGPLVRGLDAVTGRQHDGREQQEVCAYPSHTMQI